MIKKDMSRKSRKSNKANKVLKAAGAAGIILGGAVRSPSNHGQLQQ